MIYEYQAEKETVQESPRGESSKRDSTLRGMSLAPDIEADLAAGNRESESIYRGNDREEKEMQEKKLVELLDGLMSAACDNCKKIEGVSQEETDEICTDCPAGVRRGDLLNENNRYSKIVLCSECEYYRKDNDCQGNEFAWCRLKDGLDGNVDPDDGCSRGKRKGCN